MCKLERDRANNLKEFTIMVERSLEARIKALEEECTRLGDIEAIRRLRYKYCRCVNKGQWSDLDDCFAEDSIIDFGGGIQLKGRKAVGQFYSGHLSSTTAMAIVYTHNPEIEVTGDTARGLWEFDNFRVEASDKKASRTGGAYEEEYVKQDGKWKIKSLTTRFHFKQPGEWEAMKR
jgi:ketosteroid isomerase-like protein